mmetsp:Transcript_5196/g.12309  ORF Transcript_5196/g.12309 Transcript_5196/m.12309 type:complete len:270 (-) Transcript_5196:5-814(-)
MVDEQPAIKDILHFIGLEEYNSLATRHRRRPTVKRGRRRPRTRPPPEPPAHGLPGDVRGNSGVRRSPPEDRSGGPALGLSEHHLRSVRSQESLHRIDSTAPVLEIGERTLGLAAVLGDDVALARAVLLQHRLDRLLARELRGDVADKETLLHAPLAEGPGLWAPVGLGPRGELHTDGLAAVRKGRSVEALHSSSASPPRLQPHEGHPSPLQHPDLLDFQSRRLQQVPHVKFRDLRRQPVHEEALLHPASDLFILWNPHGDLRRDEIPVP